MLQTSVTVVKMTSTYVKVLKDLKDKKKSTYLNSWINHLIADTFLNLVISEAGECEDTFHSMLIVNCYLSHPK